MQLKDSVNTVVEVVVMLFASFGGFLNVVSPPPGANNSYSAAGLASFTAVLIFLVVKLLLTSYANVQYLKHIVASLAVITALLFTYTGYSYLKELDSYSFWFPPDSSSGKLLLAAETYTQIGNDYITKKPEFRGAHAALLKNFGEEKIHEVWPANGIVDKRAELTLRYVLMVLFLSICIGFTIEGLSLLSMSKI